MGVMQAMLPHQHGKELPDVSRDTGGRFERERLRARALLQERKIERGIADDSVSMILPMAYDLAALATRGPSYMVVARIDLQQTQAGSTLAWQNDGSSVLSGSRIRIQIL